MARGKSNRLLFRLFVLAVLAGLAFVGVAAFRAGAAPEITLRSGLPGIGKRTPIHVVIIEPRRGLSRVEVRFIQDQRAQTLEARTYAPLKPWKFWGERVGRDELIVEVGSETLKGLREGPAIVGVVADRASSWLRYPAPAVEQLELEVKLRPPALQVLSAQTFVAQGGSEAVVYRVGESSVRDGVQAGDWWFPGYPLPGGGDRDRFALFGVPFDLTDRDRLKLAAFDDVGNEARISFVDRFSPRSIRSDTIRLTESFMSRVVPAILSRTPELDDRGDLLANYLQLNRDLRERNARTVKELSQRTATEFLWDRPFLQMANAKVMSDFADRRVYFFDGREVDSQVHLGFDLASTRMAEIQAANDGVVVFAGYLGIYGNAVIIDHGYGLMSLYGHLSSLAVEEGREVRRGEAIGRSGQTGLAGGDHLHFTTLIHGLPVDPREWWDAHWIHDRLKLKLDSALPFDGS